MVNAVTAIGGELESCVADALEAAVCVEAASIFTQHPIVQALVNVHAGLLSRGSLEACVTLAVVGASCVDTITIGAGVRGALIYISTFSTNVLCVSGVAVAAVAGGHGDASTVQTQVGQLSADIHRLVKGSKVRLRYPITIPIGRLAIEGGVIFWSDRVQRVVRMYGVQRGLWNKWIVGVHSSTIDPGVSVWVRVDRDSLQTHPLVLL